MPASLRLFPHAKINLGLFIKGKLPNGYHLLETLLYPIFQLKDELILTREEDGGCHIQIEGIKLDSTHEENLCVRAYRALEKSCGPLPGVKISLKKCIPAGAGLGGGSSDAAFTLKGLNDLFGLGLTMEKLTQLAADLGADVPFFLYEKPMLATGIGTDLEEFELDFPYEIRLFPQNIHSSTLSAYKSLDYKEFDPKRDLREVLRSPVDQWKDHLHNDLEVPVFRMYPELGEIKAELYKEGALYAAMSGSGSAMFGIFEP